MTRKGDSKGYGSKWYHPSEHSEALIPPEVEATIVELGGQEIAAEEEQVAEAEETQETRGSDGVNSNNEDNQDEE